MHFITFSVVSILLCNSAISYTIISSDLVNDNFIDFSDDDDMAIINSGENYGNNNILETTYASQSVGKSHRFYFTAGERQNGNC